MWFLWMMEPAREYSSYDRVPTMRKLWVFVVGMFVFLPVPIAIAATGDVYRKARVVPRATDRPAVLKMTSKGKVISIVSLGVLAVFNLMTLL